MEIFTLDYLKGFFKRNKKLLIISFIIVIASFILMSVYDYLLFGPQILSANEMPTTNFLDFIELFVHNCISDAIVLLGGFGLSIFSIILTISNCVVASSFLGTNPYAFVVGIVPHGIFEYGANVFSLTGAFIITKLEIVIFKALLSKNQTVKEVLNDNKNAIKDILLIIVFIIILLLIAGLIENYITPMFIDIAF